MPKKRKQRAKNYLQNLRRWMVKPKKKSASTVKVDNKKDTPKKQQTLTRFFQGNQDSNLKNTKNQQTFKTTKNLKCISGPQTSKYIQTMLKLRRVKPDKSELEKPENHKIPIEQNKPSQPEHPGETKNMFPSPISRVKVPIDRLVMKFERWKNCKMQKSPGTAHSEEIQEKL